MVLAEIWHFWIGVALMLVVPFMLVAIGGGYLMRVVRLRYPSREQREALERQQWQELPR